MLINIGQSVESSYAFPDYFTFFEYLWSDATLIGASNISFGVQGTFQNLSGETLNFRTVSFGLDFVSGVVAGKDYIVEGNATSIEVAARNGGILYHQMMLDMQEMAGLLAQELNGSNLQAIETYMMQQDWLHVFGAGDDVMAANQTFGDGADLAFRGDVNFSGGKGDDTLRGGSGQDVLNGNLGADRLYGGSASDQLKGGKGKDVLFGGAGRDKLIGGNGADTLTGGAGGDRFVFKDGDRRDKIMDFDVGQRGEKINLKKVTAITDFADLINNHATDSAGRVVIDDNDQTKIVLMGVSVADLSMNDFLF
ncbi:MAG: hypothetical protein AB3N11_17685 [Arenibacterium sp.]